MSPLWFLLGVFVGSTSRCPPPTAAERRAIRLEVLRQRREDEKEARRQRVRDAWEKKHPWLTVAKVVSILAVVGLAIWGLSASACVPTTPTLRITIPPMEGDWKVQPFYGPIPVGPVQGPESK